MSTDHVPDRQLSGDEERDVVRRSAPRAVVIFEAIRHEAVDELARRNSALFWSGLAAGLSMGFSFIAEALLQSGMPDTHWRHLVSRLGYSVGFVIVVLGRQQLFTENTLTPVIHVLREATLAALLSALRLWGVVLAANLFGAMIFGVGLYYADVLEPQQTLALTSVAAHAAEYPFGKTLVSAIFAGWLIALMVWLLPAAETARVGVIIIITYLVGLGSFSHIVAGAAPAFYAMVAGITAPGTALLNFFLPTLMGNIIGGVAFVAALNYAQIAPDN